MKNFIQPVNLIALSAKSDSRGFATPMYPTLVGCFCQCVCYRLFNGGSAGEALASPVGTPVLQTLLESPPITTMR
ncbi:hypothetical protein ID854_01260 [Xenorhabdus sp. M]|uniref:Uncharacterized protein n=1 Tax=Xenorhabdus szentirmaii TaxID=290112 RepID=A0AAW3YN87_9GAMM|nr:hypothetical protein [Xenorhabdus sp. M]MBD2799121.1 hypothetical protein [Xenorhabdus sp. M]